MLSFSISLIVLFKCIDYSFDKASDQITCLSMLHQDLLKHTPSVHPDHAHLEKALSELTTLAEEMNEAEKEATNIDRLKDIAANIDGATDVCKLVELSLFVCLLL